MLFNSFAFLVFFPVVAILFFKTKPQHRWLLLLVASYYFYIHWIPKYALIMVVLTCIDYVAGRAIASAATKNKRRLFLIISLSCNLGLLFFFKYVNFIDGELNHFFQSQGWQARAPIFDILLPMGISFHTFQAMAYTIDVYRGVAQAEKHFGLFALYIAYFPQLVAGPIERPNQLLPQLKKHTSFDYDHVVSGFRLALWGFFKKVFIADNLAGIVNVVYAQPQSYSGEVLLLATYAFALQIFCDFSGYTDIARGTARILGVSLMENFHRPYFSKSVPEFWRRWHISLSSWFRDYLYIPICGSRNPGTVRWVVAVAAVFLLCGFWHGADWKYIVWGGLNGIFYLVHFLLKPLRQWLVKLSRLDRAPGLHKFVSAIATFNLICITWVFFRADNIQQGWVILTRIFLNHDVMSLKTMWTLYGPLAMYAGVGIVIMEWVHLKQRGATLDEMLERLPSPVRLAIYAVFMYGTLIFGNLQTNRFIYFQF